MDERTLVKEDIPDDDDDWMNLPLDKLLGKEIPTQGDIYVSKNTLLYFIDTHNKEKKDGSDTFSARNHYVKVVAVKMLVDIREWNPNDNDTPTDSDGVEEFGNFFVKTNYRDKDIRDHIDDYLLIHYTTVLTEEETGGKDATLVFIANAKTFFQLYERSG